MWYSVSNCVCACGVYPAIAGYGRCFKCGQVPVAVGPKEFYIPSTAYPIERGSVAQLVLKVRGQVAA